MDHIFDLILAILRTSLKAPARARFLSCFWTEALEVSIGFLGPSLAVLSELGTARKKPQRARCL